MAGSDELPAETRLGEYEIERVIGCGGMGTVYAAWHPVLHSRAAIKVLQREVSYNAAMVDRFVSEAQAASRITHPNIIKVFGFGELPDGRKYFVMEYLEGESMAAWLARGCPDPDQSRELLLQICEALEAAHREGIVHRDLKPDNLWIARPKHGHPYIKVLDFGIAKAVEGPFGRSNTKTGSVLGTPQFMSPEQCTGRGVDHRTDIYALGGILYLIYCGRPPFVRESPAELVAAHLYEVVPRPSSFAAMPERLEQLILACLEKDPARRPSSAAELAQRLKAVLAPSAAGVPAPRAVPPSQARTERLVALTVVDDLGAAQSGIVARAAPLVVPTMVDDVGAAQSGVVARGAPIVAPTMVDDPGTAPPAPLARTERIVMPTVGDDQATPPKPDVGELAQARVPTLLPTTAQETTTPLPTTAREQSRRHRRATAVAVVATLGLIGVWLAVHARSRQDAPGRPALPVTPAQTAPAAVRTPTAEAPPAPGAQPRSATSSAVFDVPGIPAAPRAKSDDAASARAASGKARSKGGPRAASLRGAKPPPARPPGKLSRSEREGLIKENPFE